MNKYLKEKTLEQKVDGGEGTSPECIYRKSIPGEETVSAKILRWGHGGCSRNKKWSSWVLVTALPGA